MGITYRCICDDNGLHPQCKAEDHYTTEKYERNCAAGNILNAAKNWEFFHKEGHYTDAVEGLRLLEKNIERYCSNAIQTELPYLDKVKILKHCSNIICPYCNDKLFIGAVSLEDQREALFCSKCNVRILITLKMIIKPTIEQDPIMEEGK